MQIVRANRDSDFGRRHGFAHVGSYSDFTHAVPMAQFSYYYPYIERCKQGETSAMFGPSQKLLMFALTSGTTGPAKYIPITSDFMAAYCRGWNIWGIKALADHPQVYLGKGLQISSAAEQQRTAAGYPCGAISGMLARRQKRIVRYFYATPSDVNQITDTASRHYTILRFALGENITVIVAANPSTLVALAQTGDRNAQRLIRDMYDGTLDRSLEIPAELRNKLTCRLRPNPERARWLQRLLDEHGCLLPKHYWNPAGLAHWTGGTVGLYLPQVRKYYGDRPIRDIGLLASEGRMSIPLQDNTAAGVLDICANFYEFVPEEQIGKLDLPPDCETLPDDLTILRADELERNRRYFIFLTNRAGLYRYHIGDLVQVTDYISETPVIEFLSRGAHTSSITGEKLTEHQVVGAVGAALHRVGLETTLFTLAPIWADPPYYTLYVETNRNSNPETFGGLTEQVDELLRQGNIEYESKRKSGRLGPVKIQPLNDNELTRYDRISILACSGRDEQFKHRFLLNEPINLDRGS